MNPFDASPTPTSRQSEPAREPRSLQLSADDLEGLIKNRSREERDERAIQLAKRHGLNAELFCKAVGLAQTLIEAPSSQREELLAVAVRRNYELLNQVFSEQRDDVVRELISRHLNPGVAFDESRLADYTMKPVVTARGAYRGRASLDPANLATAREDRSMPYMDAPFGLILCYRGVENAIVTMWPDRSDLNALKIPQIQGVQKIVLAEDGRSIAKRQHSRGINGFEWGDVLVEYSTILARSLGYEKIVIQSAHNNYWTGPDGDDKIHLPLEKGLICYDQRAKRLGFVERPPAKVGMLPDWERSLA